MKKMFLLSAALFVAATIFCGCSKDGIYDEGELTIDVTDLVLKCTDSEEFITINSSSAWTAKVVDADDDWISCYNTVTYLHLVICANDTYAERSASIVVRNRTQKKTINVVQKANPIDPAEIRLTVTCTEDVLQAEVAEYFGGNVASITNDNETYVITLKHGCYAIPDGAFGSNTYGFGPDWLTSVELNSSFAEIGEAAFTGCYNLTTFRGPLASPDNKSLLFENRFIAFANGCGLTSYTIPDSVTEIGSRAFGNCSSLTSVTIPDSVTEIGSGAFDDCSSLTSVTIPDSVTEIGSDAFRDCSSLTNVSIGKGITRIGSYAFSNQNIGRMVVYCNPTTPPKIASNSFAYYYDFKVARRPKTIYVPAESLQSYQYSSGWSEYSSVLKGRYL